MSCHFSCAILLSRIVLFCFYPHIRLSANQHRQLDCLTPNLVALARHHITFSKPNNIYFVFQFTKRELYRWESAFLNATPRPFDYRYLWLSEKLQLLRVTAKMYALRSSSSRFLLKCYIALRCLHSNTSFTRASVII